MALLAFEDARSSPVADLMDISQRQKTASELNAAILSSQCQVGRRCARSQCDLKSGCACSHNLHQCCQELPQSLHSLGIS